MLDILFSVHLLPALQILISHPLPGMPNGSFERQSSSGIILICALMA